MTLGEQQSLFVVLSVQFMQWVLAQGYELTYGEAWRSPAEAQIDQQEGIGVANSLHTLRLAIDLNLKKDGVLLTTKDDYAPLGAQWLTMHELARWGGNFQKIDADHFSLTWMGVQ
jgi:D-alanyl-D-alanine carboxypeptidase